MSIITEDKNWQFWNTIVRGKVILAKDPKKQGRVKIWIPDLMPLVQETKGLWARPANNPLGGRNTTEDGDDHHYQGSCMIPPKGSWIYIFFENGDPSEPRYFAAADMCTTKGGNDKPSVVAECRQGAEWHQKWVPVKTRQGRCIILSDDKEDQRVEITGKKRKLEGGPEPPNGPDDSVYVIDGNQTVILIGEKKGKEKVLIRTHKGDFLHIDVDERMLHGYFKNGIRLKTDGDYHLKVKGNMNVEVGGSEKTTVGKERHVSVGNDQRHMVNGNDYYLAGKARTEMVQGENNSISMGNLNLACKQFNIQATDKITVQATNQVNIMGDNTGVNVDGKEIHLNSQKTVPNRILPAAPTDAFFKSVPGASPAICMDPIGERDS
jgi:hypothetical protein